MNRRLARDTYGHQFVEHLPDKLEEGLLYISVRYATAAHNCFCGCGREVVTPLHPTKWKLTFDGVTASLRPSVGSWSLPCRSHYWLENGRIEWADTFSDDKIRAVQQRDASDQQAYYSKPIAPAVQPAADRTPPKPAGRWRKFLNSFWGG
jgi:hypothetical protein